MRFRLYLTAAQAEILERYCAHARFVWNLAVEQQQFALRYRPYRIGPRRHWPNNKERSRQLTEARATFSWLANGSVTVQQQALRDYAQALNNHFDNPNHFGWPKFRRKDATQGFRIVGTQAQRVRQINRRWSEVLVPKVGWVRFRRTRPVPDAKSYRVTLDRAGRWHIAFVAIPEPIDGPIDGSVVGIDRGIAVTLALSDGTTYQAPAERSVKRLQRRLARAQRGSNRRAKVKCRLARAYARNADARKDFVEKSSTTIAKSYDLIRIEDLKVANMTKSARGTVVKPGKNVAAKTGLNRAIRQQSWSLFATRLEQKAVSRVEKISPAFTSQCCSRCGFVASESRESQSRFCCVVCGVTINADLNAARNIAAGHAGTARGGVGLSTAPVNREPQLELVS